ncbi:MAG: DNA polymerase IV [Clostridia bacterium]|nr:DNA polymerase IV [Clostridia bacterium]
MSRSILHCDMNNFYASVECMLDPSLKKYPVAVCGSVEERHGIVLAKNYAAKAFDVKTGDAVWQAKQKCKDLVIVPPHYEEYIKYSKLARSVYSRFTDQVEPYGMDECWLDISGTERIYGSPERVANEIRETIKFELGLTISVGVSFNKIFAKLGSDMKKPDAITVIKKETFRDKIWGLPAADLLGVGRATQRVLDSYCIRTIGDLAKTDPDFLQRRLGKNGVALWQYANGNDHSLVHNADFVSPIKSVGHGITTVADLEENEQVWPVFLELTQDIGHKLRVHQKCADGVAIHIRDNTLFSKQWQMKLDMPTQSSMLIAKTAFSLFEKRYDWRNPIRSVTIQAINLVPQDTPRQIDMFTNVERIEKLEKLDLCIETIRQRFGKDSIKNAVLCQNLRLPPEKAELTMPTGMLS